MYDWKAVAVCVILCLEPTTCLFRDFAICHNDFENDPADGVQKEHTFTWLGFVQYIMEMTGLPHHSKAPRVILVHKQFALGTAKDMMHPPKNYKIGNIIFGDYERDEEECGLTHQQIKYGLKCSRAYIEIPPLHITPHPEFTRFGVGNSLALVKLIRPLKSNYMLPICLPTLTERTRRKKFRDVYLVDYISTVPRDFDLERLAKKTLNLFTHSECKEHRTKWKLDSEGVTHLLCTSGCGVRSGAPIISHAKSGAYELLGLTAGGGPCHHRSMRRRLNNEPLLYIDVFPYNTWIENVIMAHQLPKPYPQHFMLVDAGYKKGINLSYLRKRRKQRQGWQAHTYLTGDFCYSKRKNIQRNTFFYLERFEVNSDDCNPARLNIIMKISAGIECTIVCARLELPNRLSVPRIEGVGGYNITISFQLDKLPSVFHFTLGLDGKNTSKEDAKEWIKERPIRFW